METLYREKAFIFRETSDMLCVFTARGRSRIRGKDIGEAHEILFPVLPQLIRIAEFTSGFPKEASGTILRYLDALCRAGALSKAEASGTRLVSNQQIRDAGPSFVVLGDENVPYQHKPQPGFESPAIVEQTIQIVAEKDIASALIQYGRTPTPCGVLVIVENPSSERTHYGRVLEWLKLACREQANLRDKFTIFRSKSAEPGLYRLYAAPEGGRWDRRALAEGIALVRPADCDQMPVVVAQCEMGNSVRTPMLFGLRYDDWFIDLSLARLFQAEIQVRPDTTAAAELSTESNVVGLDRDSVICRLVEQHLDSAHTSQRANACDLLKEKSRDADILYLQRVIEMRIDSVPCVTSLSNREVFAYECAGRRWSSLFKEKALRDALLAVAFETYHPPLKANAETALAVDYRPYASPSQLRLCVQQYQQRCDFPAADRPFIIRRESLFGMEIWSGEIRR